MKIQRNSFKELEKRVAKVTDAEEKASELLRTAQDRFGLREHSFSRDGKEVTVTEKILWEEVFYLGEGSQAGEILTEKHPQVFAAYEEQSQAAEELKKFCITELGIDYTKMTIADYLRMTEGVVNLILEERGERPYTRSRIARFFSRHTS